MREEDGMHTHTDAQRHRCTDAQMHRCTDAQRHKGMNTFTYAHMHACMHVLMHTHAHTHTHTGHLCIQKLVAWRKRRRKKKRRKSPFEDPQFHLQGPWVKNKIKIKK